MLFLKASSFGRPGVKPLCWSDEENLIAYANGKIIVIKGDQEKDLCDLPLSKLKRKFSYSRVASRILRIEPRAALVVDNMVLVAWMGMILCIDLRDGSSKTLLAPRAGFSNPLYFTRAESDGLLAVWGDYGTNLDRFSVAIRGIGSDGVVRSLFEFEPGCIRHIHGIIPRKTGSGGYYVFTGDMEEESGIYIATSNFSNVRPLAVGEQRFRAVRGFAVEEGLLYATDSASIENHVYRLIEDGEGSWSRLDDLGILNGPCIYGGQVEDGYLFTTTVEPDESLQGVASLMSRSIGCGVLTPEATAVFVNSSGKMYEIARIESDGLPLKAFQYGSLQIPSGVLSREHIWAYACALKGVDGKAIQMKMGTL